MKILHIGNIKSGIDTYVRNTIAFASNEFEFVVVNGKDDKSESYFRYGNKVNQYTIDMYRSLNPFRDIKAIFQAVRIIKKENPDLIHCHSAKGGVIGRIASFITNKKVVYTAHAFSFLSANKKIKYYIYILFERITRLNSYFLACSQSEQMLGINKVGYRASKTYYWNNAIKKIVDSDVVEPDDHIKNQEYIISIGRPSYQKNPLLMVEIMRKVHEKYPNVKFYLLGVGFYSPMLGKMKTLVHKYGLDDIIILLPWLSHKETIGYLKYAQLYLTTSLYEGLPIAVLEALAMKKAIVSSDVLGNCDCVWDNKNGYLLKLERDQFVDKIGYLLTHKDILNKMSENSYSIFESRFNIENRICELEQIYKYIFGDS